MVAAWRDIGFFPTNHGQKPQIGGYAFSRIVNSNQGKKYNWWFKKMPLSKEAYQIEFKMEILILNSCQPSGGESWPANDAKTAYQKIRWSTLPHKSKHQWWAQIWYQGYIWTRGRAENLSSVPGYDGEVQIERFHWHLTEGSGMAHRDQNTPDCKRWLPEE